MNPTRGERVWIVVLVVWTVVIFTLLVFGAFGPPVPGIG